MRKKMINVFVVVFGFALAGVVLTGCGESQQSSQDTQQGISTSISEETGQDSIAEKTETDEAEKTGTDETKETGTDEAEKTEQESKEYEDNFAVDSDAAKEFAEKVKDAVAQKDLEALAELTAFPVYVGLPGVSVVKTKEEFLELGAEAVFTDELLEAVEKADIENFKPSMAGFSISAGKITGINFGVVDGVLAISGINY